jgi:hypothetical protein
MTVVRARLTAVVLVAFVAVLWPAVTARGDTSGMVSVQTVPALGGVQLLIGDASATTDASGTASVHVSNLNGISKSVAVADPNLADGLRVGLGKVAVLPHVAAHESRLRVGLNIWSTVHLRLRPGPTGIAAATVTSIRLRSVTGDVVTVHPHHSRKVELLARRPQLVHNVLISQPVTWSVAGIEAGQGVALTSSSTRFDPFGRSHWNLALQPVSGTVHVTTVPATPNVQFLVEGISTVTGADGTATAPIADLNSVATRVALGSPSAGELGVSLLRIRRAPPTAVHERELVVGLAVRRPVTMHFTDLTGASVSPDRVTSASIKVDGVTVRLSGSDVRAPVLLLSAKAMLVRNSWHVHDVSYSMSSATIDGGQAVFTGQQHFQPSAAGSWTVKLSLFRVRVTTHDALLGTRVGSRLVVTRPDRSTYATTVSSSGAGALMTSVVRGNYDLHFSAALLGSTTSLRISRSDTFDIRVVTPIDVALVGGVVALLVVSAALGALHVSRRAEREQR